MAPPFSLSHLTTADAGAVTALWQSHYGGDDWTWVGGPEALLPYLRDHQVVGLALRRDGDLVATIFAVPFGETTRMSHGASVAGFYVVEGLVVHEALRGQGVAGWMIAAIDGTMSRLSAPRPFACLWARELAVRPAFPTVVSCRPYAWKACEKGILPEGWTLCSAATFASHWSAIVEAALAAGAPVIATTSIDARRGGVSFVLGPRGTDSLRVEGVVVSDTCRATKDGQHIYEVVWASSAVAVDVATTLVTGLLFTTCAVRTGWSTGTSGFHAYSIYNYWPPAFGSCEILALREEL